MKKMIFLIIVLVAPIACGALGTWPINNRNVSNDDLLRRLLQDRIGGLESAVGEIGNSTVTGKVYYVDSAVGNDSWNGLTAATAVATLDAGINLTTANNGDIIKVAEGHAETIDNGTSDAIDFDVAGVTVVGHGYGSDMPEITFDTATDEIAIDADNVIISGIRFLAGVTAVTTAFDVKNGADDCAIVNCEFPEPTTSTFEFVRAVTITTADRFVFANNIYRNMDAIGSTNVVDLDGGVVNGFYAIGNDIMGEFAEGAIHSDDVDLEVIIQGNTIYNATTGQHGIEFTAAAVGFAINNLVGTDTVAASYDLGSLGDAGNLWDDTDTADTSSVIWTTEETGVNVWGASRLAQIEAEAVDALESMPAIKAITATTTDVSNDTVLFTVASGPIKLIEIIGIVGTGIQAQGCLINYNVAATTPAGDTVFGTDGTALEINGDASGTLYTWSGVIAADLVATTAGVALGFASGTTTGLIVPPGDIELKTTATNTGTITFYMRYVPLSTASTVTTAL